MSEHQDIVMRWLTPLSARFPGTSLAADTDLIEQGVLDSVEILNLVSFLEQEFAITVGVDEFIPENFQTPRAIAVMVTRLGNAGK